MITQYGMSEKFGLIGLSNKEDQYLSGRMVMNCAEATSSQIDEEVMKMLKEAYEEANSKLPNLGDFVTTNDGLKGEVQSVNVLKQIVRVIVTLENDEKEARDYKVDDLRFKPRKKKEKIAIDDELRALELLEKKEGKSLLDDE